MAIVLHFEMPDELLTKVKAIAAGRGETLEQFFISEMELIVRDDEYENDPRFQEAVIASVNDPSPGRLLEP